MYLNILVRLFWSVFLIVLGWQQFTKPNNVQAYTSSAHCIVRPWPKAVPHLTSPAFPLANTTLLCLCVLSVCYWVFLLKSLHHLSSSPLKPPPLWQLSVPCNHACVSIFQFFCSLDSTYKWDHMVFEMYFIVLPADSSFCSLFTEGNASQ